MAGDIEENVEIRVSGAEGLVSAAADAEELKNRIDAVRDAWAEEGAAAGTAGAEGAAAAAEQAAALEAAKEAASGLRDRLAESDAAALSNASSIGALAKSVEGVAFSGGKWRDSQGRVGDPFAQAIRDRYANVEREIQQGSRSAEEMSRAMKDMEKSIPREGMLGGQAALRASADMERYAESIRGAEDALRQADPVISDSGAAIGDLSRHAGIASAAMGNWHSTMSDFGAGGSDIGAVTAASRELDGALSDMNRSGDSAVHTLQDLGRGGGDAVRGLEDLTGGRGGRGGIFGAIASGASGAFSAISGGVTGLSQIGSSAGPMLGKLQSFLMPAMWTSLASAVSTMGPVLLSAGAGFASFGALAFPALDKVKHGLTGVIQARQAYQQAEAVYKADPTKANLTAEQTALARLKATWSTMPPDIRKSVSAILDLGHAFSEAGKKSGIQQAALKDIPKAIGDIKGLIPSIQSLATATKPIISGMLTDFGKFEKSKGFENFIGNIRRQIPLAMPGLHALGGAFSTLMSSLFSPQNMKVGDSLLTNISGMLKSLTPGAVHELTQVGKILSGSASWTTREQKPGGGLQQMGRYWDDFWHGASNAYKWLSQASSDTTAVQQMTKRSFTQSARKGAFLSPFQVMPFNPADGKGGQLNYEQQLREAEDYKLAHAGRVIGGAQKVPGLKINTSVSGAAAAKAHLSGIRSEAEKVAHTKADVKVSSTGAAKAKTGIDQLHSDAKKLSSTRATIKVSVSGGGQATSQLNTLHSKAAQSWPQPKIAVAVTGTQSAVSNLNSVSTGASQMASGVSSGASRAVSAVNSMASQMRGAVAGIPAAFRAAGASAGAGMAAGISASTGEAVAAARSMAAQVEAAAKTQLQTHSPSKKFQVIGQNTVQGYILGLLGGQSQVQAAIHALLTGSKWTDTTITSAVKHLQKLITQKMTGVFTNPLRDAQLSGLSKELTADNKRLQQLALQRHNLISEINAADALASSVRSAAISGASITSIAPNTQQGLIQANMAQGAPGSQQNPYQSIQQGMKYQLGQIKQFRADIIKLKKEGLDETDIRQLLSAGVTGGGLSTAEQILGEGPGAVKQISSLQKQISAASKALGITGANASYEAGSQIGEGLAAGLKASLKSVDAAMGNIAKTLLTGIMTALGDSPKQIREALRKLDKELGVSGGSGGGGGAKPGPIVHRGPRRGAHPGPIIEHRPTGGIAHPAMVMGGNETNQTMVNVTVLLDGKEMSHKVQTEVLQRAHRNWRGGMQLPGRAV